MTETSRSPQPRFSNKLSDSEAERLAILLEELGEAQQVIGKILRHGYESFDPARADEPFIESEGTNRCDLERELGDIAAIIDMMCAANDVHDSIITKRAVAKLDKIKPYLHHQWGGANPMSAPEFKPSISLLVKLGSIAVHADEMTTMTVEAQRGAEHDKVAIRQLLEDLEVSQWLAALGKRAMLPVKR